MSFNDELLCLFTRLFFFYYKKRKRLHRKSIITTNYNVA